MQPFEGVFSWAKAPRVGVTGVNVENSEISRGKLHCCTAARGGKAGLTGLHGPAKRPK